MTGLAWVALARMVETVDAVIIGGGHNGLVAANLLADEGWDVLVLEATARAGGAVTSDTITLAGPGPGPGPGPSPGGEFTTDRCSAFYPLCAVSPAILRLRLAEHGLSWTHAPAVLAHAFPDGRAAVLHRDPAETAASLDSFASGDGERWLRLYREWLTYDEAFLAALLTPFPPAMAGARLAAALGTSGALRLARRCVLSARAFGEQTFAGEGARALITGLALHTDLSPESAGGAAFGLLLAMVGQRTGFPVPVGGAQRITDALVARLTSVGGRIECSATVDRVLVAAGRAVGVRRAGGPPVRARRAVLADVPAPLLYTDLVAPEHLPRQLLADVEAFRWDDATLKVDWLLSDPPRWLAPGVAGAGTVHLGVGVDGCTRYSADLATGRVPPEPLIIAGQMSTADPSRSPEGTEVMWAYTHLPRGVRTAEMIEQVERIEAAVERVAPGFRDLVLHREITGPGRLAARNPSLVGGAIGGGTSAPYQQLIFRPVPGIGRADTPVDRLYLASASAHPGAGVHGACGANAARAALARDRALTGAGYGAAVRMAHRAIYGGRRAGGYR
jgi:phytoene dehydrogenase-like protein